MVPEADIVFVKFHVSKHLNEAVDTLRRQEKNGSSERRTIHSLAHANVCFTPPPPTQPSEGQQARFEKVK
jgi:hypothetical protein